MKKEWIIALKNKSKETDIANNTKSFIDFDDRNDGLHISVCVGKYDIKNRDETTGGFSWIIKNENDFQMILDSIGGFNNFWSKFQI